MKILNLKNHALLDLFQRPKSLEILLYIQKLVILRRYTGSFIIIDKYSNNTLGAGMILESAISSTSKKTKQYTKAEIELNKYIRENFPEWECKAI